MQKHRDLTLKRLQTFQKLLESKIYTKAMPVELSHFAAPGRIKVEEAMRAQYQTVTLGTRFQPFWSTHWFKIHSIIPNEWEGQEVHFLWDSSSEACIWVDGQPKQGLTGSNNGYSDDPVRSAFPVVLKATGGEVVNLMVEAAMNNFFGISTSDPRKNEGIGWLRQAELAIFDRNVWNIYWDYVIVADMARYLPQDSPRAGQALFAANQMVNTIDWDDLTSFQLAREIAAEFLSQTNGEGQHRLSVLGHAHIDTAWLWPIAETKRKCVRTFSSALNLMESYPQFRFICSQAQQLNWIKLEYPDLYQRIQKKVRAGQFIPAGGTWVEPDTNVPNGESLVRQFLYGQKFFDQEFGAISEIFWEPDVFGYSAALPQIMRLAGVKYFLTQKLSWNEFNKPIRHSFLWEGLDGSRVMAHFPPVDTYNSLATVKEVLFNVKNYQDHERSKESILLYGYGDGGGGPSVEMLEQIARMSNVDGLPLVEHRSPQDFFERLEHDLKDPTVWVGELYFENHRGTYTSQAAVKLGNRRCEEKLHDVEFLSSLAMLFSKSPYPFAELLELWQQVLTNQFHDILPGSSIAEVYQDAKAVYKEVLANGDQLRKKALKSLLKDSEGYTLVNTLGCRRLEVIPLPEGSSGQQVIDTGEILGVVEIGPYQLQPLETTKKQENRIVQIIEDQHGFTLENDFVQVNINMNGQITSLIEKTNHRQCIAIHEFANQFVLYEDLPYDYDAWNADIYYAEKIKHRPVANQIRIVESGPLRVKIALEMKVGKESTLKQTISLTAISTQIDFETWVEWQESHSFLRVLFPLNLRSSFATYETQYGWVQRPTHYNTSFDLAQFEVPAQRWADFSEPDFGISLLNNCKYGYACHGSVLSLSLLRAPKDPDPNADMGAHHFSYALWPHALTPQLSTVWWQAAQFNQPLQFVKGLPVQNDLQLFTVNAPNIVLDTIKAAEDGDGIVIRMVEVAGIHTKSVLYWKNEFLLVETCDLLERKLESVAHSGKKLEIDFKPFEIISLHFHTD
ncbi:MAG: alpha-mannosidase [Anaerolineaceae bacterium]